MILYEYQCQICNNIIECYQSIKEKEYKKLECDKCNAIVDVKKIITSMNFKLDYSDGWSKTGYDKNIDIVSEHL